MWPKEQGWVLTIDPASIQCAAALRFNGEPYARITLKAEKKAKFSKRLQQLQEQLQSFLDECLGEEPVEKVIVEGVRSEKVSQTVGAFMICTQIDSSLGKNMVIHAPTWKSWARKQGATYEGTYLNIKGIKALQDIGWDFDKNPIASDDEADCELLYMAWRDRK